MLRDAIAILSRPIDSRSGSPPPLLHGRDRSRLILDEPAGIGIRTVGCGLPALHDSGARPANGRGTAEAWHAPSPRRSTGLISLVPSRFMPAWPTMFPRGRNSDISLCQRRSDWLSHGRTDSHYDALFPWRGKSQFLNTPVWTAHGAEENLYVLYCFQGVGPPPKIDSPLCLLEDVWPGWPSPRITVPRGNPLAPHGRI